MLRDEIKLDEIGSNLHSSSDNGALRVLSGCPRNSESASRWYAGVIGKTAFKRAFKTRLLRVYSLREGLSKAFPVPSAFTPSAGLPEPNLKVSTR